MAFGTVNALYKWHLLIASLFQAFRLRLTTTAWIRQVIQQAIFTTDEQIPDAIAIPIDRRRACGVARQSTIIERTLVLERHVTVLLADVAQKRDVDTVHEQVAFAIAIPIDDAQLATPTPARDSIVES